MQPLPTPSSRARRLLPVMLALAVLVPAGLYASGLLASTKTATPHEAPPVPVTTARVLAEPMPIAANGIGTVQPVSSVTVHTRVDGQLDRVDFKEGQEVRAGQALAHLDPRTYQAQLAQAQAQKARDEAQLANARADLTRFEALVKEDAVTQQALDTQRALVKQLQATVQSDDAAVNYAQVQMGFTTISAPTSGRIGARLVDPGNIVHAADPNGLLVINQIDPINLQFTLPESSFQAVNQAMRPNTPPPVVQAIDRASGAVLATGKLVLLNNQIDTATGTIALKAQFANPQHHLWPGQSLGAHIVLGQRADALTVPSAAVQRGQDGLYAYVVNADNTVRVQPITVADSQGGKSVVEKGLSSGDRVVVDGQFRLTPGARVNEAATKTGAGS